MTNTNENTNENNNDSCVTHVAMIHFADMVEEQELKERIVELCLLIHHYQGGLREDLRNVLDRYDIVKNRNEAIRREYYNEAIRS